MRNREGSKMDEKQITKNKNIYNNNNLKFKKKKKKQFEREGGRGTRLVNIRNR